MEGNHLYINAGQNAVYTNPSLPIAALGSSLPTFMGELCPCKDWLRIFQAYLEEETSAAEAKAYMTPKKCKHRYLGDDEDLAMDSPLESLPSLTSWDNNNPEIFQAFAMALKKLKLVLSLFNEHLGKILTA